MDPDYICECIRMYAGEYYKDPDICIPKREFKKRSYAKFAIDCICKEIQENSFLLISTDFSSVNIINKFSEKMLEFAEENKKNYEMFKIMYDVSCDIEEFLRAMY